MEYFLSGFAVATTLTNLIYCFLGVFVGTFIGVLPGLGPLSAIAILLPVTFYLDPTTAIILLAGVYYGGEYGGSTASILLNIPGTPSSAVTCIDGHPLATQGRAGVALLVTTVASFVGGSLGILVLMFAAPQLAAATLLFGPAEYTGVIVFGLLCSGIIARDAPLKGLAMIVLGVLFGSVGTDMQTGDLRYGLGLPSLYDGFSIIIVVLGIFGVSEIICSLQTAVARGHVQNRISLRSVLPTRVESKLLHGPMLRGSAIGVLLGALPGTGPLLASYFSYATEVRVSRTPEKFGKGAIQGIAGPESANNAAVQASFVPMMALGIPGSATTAVLMGALTIHGIAPGPRFISEMPELFWGLVASFWIGNIILLVLNIPLMGIWVSLLRIPYVYLYPPLLCLISIGALAVNNNPIDIVYVFMFGIGGYFGRRYGYEAAPFLIGFLLGPLLEQNLRRAMLISGGDYTQLLTHPISGTLLALSVVVLLYGVVSTLRR